mgnify:CR=1 FL=1
MKNIKRILAVIGVILLSECMSALSYLALIGSPASDDLLKASIAATILIPVLLYGFILITRLLKNKNNQNDD